MLAVKLFTPLAWTWYVLVGTVITFAVGSIASVIAGTDRARVSERFSE
jgi:hypothetical protein